MTIQTIELNPKNVYTICVEVGDMEPKQVNQYISDVKRLYAELGIKSICVPMRNGVSTVEIVELPCYITEEETK